MIEANELTKRYGAVVAVDGLSFRVPDGQVTAFLGPNGAGKSTTMRLVLGLDAPTGGWARIGGRAYRDLPVPLREVGALLDARAAHPGRTAVAHLRWVARSSGIGDRRVAEVLDLVGLSDVAHRRAGGFSLGMGQRLGLATALLGDPPVLVLDEPVNGLDADGIRWVRALLRGLADEGRTVLLSSHLMAEVERTADRLLVVGGGRLLADMAMDAFVASNSPVTTVVRSADGERLAAEVRARGAGAEPAGPCCDGRWRVTGMAAPEVGALAHTHGIELQELTPQVASLEEAYLRLTGADTPSEARP